MPQNEAFGWIWILAGFVSGLFLGLRFHEEDWLGGYASLRRRLIRLGHISFLGLGFLNLLFALSGADARLDPLWLSVASWALIAGGVTMPACCWLMAWRRELHSLFAVPVSSLILGVALVVAGFLRS